MIWDGQSCKEPFQEILDRRILDFEHVFCSKKQNSGMTGHQEWMLSLGIRFNFSGKASGRRFYDVTTRGWDPTCKWGQFKAVALLVPEDLYLKTLVLGYLP